MSLTGAKLHFAFTAFASPSFATAIVISILVILLLIFLFTSHSISKDIIVLVESISLFTIPDFAVMVTGTWDMNNGNKDINKNIL